MVTGFHSHFFHPHLTSPIKGEEAFWQFGQTLIKSPLRGGNLRPPAPRVEPHLFNPQAT